MQPRKRIKTPRIKNTHTTNLLEALDSLSDCATDFGYLLGAEEEECNSAYNGELGHAQPKQAANAETLLSSVSGHDHGSGAAVIPREEIFSAMVEEDRVAGRESRWR